MIYKIEYHKIQSDHILASPTFHREEYVTADTLTDIFKYIKTQKDDWGNKYKRSDNKHFGFDFTSKYGRIKLYRVKIKKL